MASWFTLFEIRKHCFDIRSESTSQVNFFVAKRNGYKRKQESI